MEVGSLAEWVGALLTGGGILIAALVYRSDRRDRISESARHVHANYLPDETVVIRNDGPAPARDVSVTLAELVGDADPGEPGAFMFVEVLAPGERRTFDVTQDDGSVAFSSEHPVPDPSAGFALSLEFIDGEGRAWRRDHPGKLRRTR